MKKLFIGSFLSLLCFTGATYAAGKCYADRSDFCGCMKTEQVSECEKVMGKGGWCSLSNIIYSVQLKTIEATCRDHLQTTHGSEYNNCVDGLTCFMYGYSNLDSSHPCRKKCSY